MFAEEILRRRNEVREGINISSRPSVLSVKIKIRVLSGNYAEHSYALMLSAGSRLSRVPILIW